MDTVNKARRTKSVTKSRRVSARLNSVKKSPSKGAVAGPDEEDSVCALGTSFEENSGSLDKIIQERECDEEMEETLNKSDGGFQENTESIHEIPSNDELKPKNINVDADVQQKCKDLEPLTDDETLSHDEAVDLEEFGSDFSGEDLLGKKKQDLANSVQQFKEESPNKIVDELQDSAMEVDQDLGKFCIVIDLQNHDFDLIDLISSAFGMMSSSRTEDSSKATMTYSKMTDAILAARVLGRLQLGDSRLSVQCSLIANDLHCDLAEEEQDLMTKVSEILFDEEESFTWHQDSVGSAAAAVEANLPDDKQDPSLGEEDAILLSLETSKRPREEHDNFDHGQLGGAKKKRSRYERLSLEKNTEQQELESNTGSIGDEEEDEEQPEGSDNGLDIEDVGIDLDDNDADMFDYEYSEEEVEKEHTDIAKMLLENKDKSWEALDMDDAFAKENSDSISTTTIKLKIPEMSDDVKMVNLLLKSVDDTPLLDLFVKDIAAIKVFYVESFHQSEKGWQLAVPKCYAAEIHAVLDGCRLLDCTLAASLDTDEDISRDPWDHFLPVREEIKAFVRYYDEKQLRKYVNLFIYSHSMDPLTYKTMICNSKNCRMNDCMFSHSPAALRQPVVYRSDNGRNLSLYKAPSGKYNKNLITNFFNKICEHATSSGECSVFTFCRNSHPDSPDMFFHKSWTDLYVKGLNKSLPFLAAAIRNLTVNNAKKVIPKKNKQRQKSNKSCMVLFITQSLESVQLARQAVQHLCNTHCQPIAVNLDKPSSECTPVVIATVSQVLSAVVQNRSLFVSFKCLILDDASALLAGDSAAMLQYFFSRLWIIRRNPETVNKVVVCSKVQQDEVARMETLLQTTFSIKSSIPIIDKYLPSSALLVPGNLKALELKKSDVARNVTCDLHAKKVRELAMASYAEASSSSEQATHPRTPKGIPTVPNVASLSRGLSKRLGHVEAPFSRRAPVNGGDTFGQANRGHGSLERTRGSHRDRSLHTLDHRPKNRDRSLHAEHDVSGMDYDLSPRMEHEDRHPSRSASRSYLSNANSFRDGSSDRNRGRNGPISSSTYKLANRQGREGLLPAERLVAVKRAPSDLLRDNTGEQIRTEQESFRDELVSRARNMESRTRALLPTPRVMASQHLGQSSSSRLSQRKQAFDVEQETLRKRQQAVEVEQATLRKRQQVIEMERATLLERQNLLEEHQLLSSRRSRASLDSREELISRREISSSPWDKLPMTIVDRTGEGELPESRSRRSDQTAQHLTRYDSTSYDEPPAVLKGTSQFLNKRPNKAQHSAPPRLSRPRSTDPAPIERSKQWRLDTEALSFAFDSSDLGSHARKPLLSATLPSKRRSQQGQLDDEDLSFAPAPSGRGYRRLDDVDLPFAPAPSGRGSRRLDAEALPFAPAPSGRESRRLDDVDLPFAPAPSGRGSRRFDAEALPFAPAPSGRGSRRLDDEDLPFPPAPSGRGSRRLDAESVPFFSASSDREAHAHKPGTNPLGRSQKWRLDADARPTVPAPSDRETHANKATASVTQKRSQQWRLDDEALPFAPAPSGHGARRLDSEAVPFFPSSSYREPLALKPMPPATEPLQRKSANGSASAGPARAATGGRSNTGLQAMLNSLVSASHAVPAVGSAVKAIALAAGNYGQNTRKALDLLAEPDHVSLLKVYLNQLQEINETDSTDNGIYESTLVYGKGLLNLIKKHVVL